MACRWVAAAKGLAVGVLTLCISVAGALAYLNSRSSACAGTGLDPECNAGLTELAILLSVLFALMLVLGRCSPGGSCSPSPAAM